MSEAMPEWTKRFGLEGRRALVTGASKGIGLVTCQVLASPASDFVCGEILMIDALTVKLNRA
jgi:hypothetical protein